MASFVIRPVQPEDLDGYFDVRALTFNDGNPVAEERRKFEYTRGYVALADGEITAGFAILDLSCTRGPARLDCAGIAGVAVYPHRRRTGIGSAMMAWIPRHLREVGTPIANLYAFREHFYRRFGYEVAGKRLKITCPTHRLPKTDSSLTIRRLRPADWPLLDACYSEFAHARSGMCLRTELLWRRVLGENRPLTIYAAGDPVESFAVVSHSTPFWTSDHISDVAWSSAAGYEALLQIFAAIGINKCALSWFEPSDSPFYARYLDQGVEIKLDRPVMYRICDVPGALRMLRPEGKGEFTLQVRDSLVPENEGPWRVVFRDGEVLVENAPQADLSLDIRVFAQVFLGEPSLVDAVRLGLVDLQDAAALNAAIRLLPPMPVVCNEFF